MIRPGGGERQREQEKEQRRASHQLELDERRTRSRAARNTCANTRARVRQRKCFELTLQALSWSHYVPASSPTVRECDR